MKIKKTYHYPGVIARRPRADEAISTGSIPSRLPRRFAPRNDNFSPETWVVTKTLLILCLLVILSGCKRDPIERLVNPLPDGALPQSDGIFILFDDELKTGGGLSLIPGAGSQVLDLNDQSSPRQSQSQFRYEWSGQDVLGQHLFAGFQILNSLSNAGFTSTSGRDLSSFGYTRLTMKIRGSLSANTSLRIEGPSGGTGADTPAQLNIESSALPSGWTDLSMSIVGSNFSNVNVFMTVTFQYNQAPRTTNPGDGGIIYFDDIKLER